MKKSKLNSLYLIHLTIRIVKLFLYIIDYL